MVRRSNFSLSLLACLLMLVAGPGTAAAQTIDFGGLAGNNGDLFTGPYSEDGFSVRLLSGAICVAKVFGNPVPDLFGGSACSSSSFAVLGVTQNDGGLFRFLAADIAANNGSVSFAFLGLLGGGYEYATRGVVAENTAVFQNVGNPEAGTAIDELKILLYAGGTSFNIDNLALAAVSVPEPGSMALIATGLLGLFLLRRRRKDVLSD